MRDLTLYGQRVRTVKVPRLPVAVIVDMDGTLVDVSGVRHHAFAGDYDAFHKASADCPPIPDTVEWCRRHHEKGRTILAVTARMQRYHGLSKDWLDKHLPVPHLGPFMRADGDYRPDHQVKRELYEQLSTQYRIVAACDDRPEICELWRSLGLEVTVVPGWEGE